jgi:hypothetical protein
MGAGASAKKKGGVLTDDDLHEQLAGHTKVRGVWGFLQHSPGTLAFSKPSFSEMLQLSPNAS